METLIVLVPLSTRLRRAEAQPTIATAGSYDPP